MQITRQALFNTFESNPRRKNANADVDSEAGMQTLNLNIRQNKNSDANNRNALLPKAPPLKGGWGVETQHAANPKTSTQLRIKTATPTIATRRYEKPPFEGGLGVSPKP